VRKGCRIAKELQVGEKGNHSALGFVERGCVMGVYLKKKGKISPKGLKTLSHGIKKLKNKTRAAICVRTEGGSIRNEGENGSFQDSWAVGGGRGKKRFQVGKSGTGGLEHLTGVRMPRWRL